MQDTTSTALTTATPSTTTAPNTSRISMSTAPYPDSRMAQPAHEHEHECKQEHEHEHEHEYKQENEHEHHHEHHHGVPLNQDEEEVLLARIRAQVDFYFSPQNLAQDHFLCSLLTSHEHYGAVPVQQICGFPKIRQLVAAAAAAAATHANANMSADMAQLPPADPELLCRAVAHKSDWVRVVGDAATGYWFVPFTLPDHTNHQSWYMSSQKQHQQTYPRRSHPHAYYPQHEQQQQQHARMVSGPPPPPPPSPPKKVPTSPTTTVMTSSSASASFSSSTSEATLQGTYPHVQKHHDQKQQHVQHPVVKERTVVLVHDIPDAHAEQDIWQLFSGRRRRQDNNSSASDVVHEYTITTFYPKSVVQDVGRTWHVTYGTEQEATAALLASRDKMYRDMPIRAGLKNDSADHNQSAAANNYGMQYFYLHQQQLQPHWQHPTPGNGQGGSHYCMTVQPPMSYGTVQHAHQHQHQQYSYGYAVMPPIIMSPPMMVPGMYAGVGSGPSHQIGYAVPTDYANNSHYQYTGAVPASPPPPPPATPPPPQQVFVRSNQPSSNKEGDAADVVVDDNQEESTAQAKSSSQDTATTTILDDGDPQKNSSRAKKSRNNKGYSDKSGHKYQRNGRNQRWSGDPQKDGGGQHPQHQHQKKKGRTSGHKNKKSRGKQQQDNAEASRNLTEEHFPVLGDSSKKKTHHVNSEPKKVAYAEALLKPPALTSVPSGEPTGQTRTIKKESNVERQMKELCLSEQGPSQQSSE
jgi:hypothetical protein